MTELIYYFLLPQVIVLGGALWVWSGADGEYMRKSVSEWSNDDVVGWVDGLGQWTKPNITQIFIKEVCELQYLTTPLSKSDGPMILCFRPSLGHS